MSFIKLAASTATILALTAPAASARIHTAAVAPDEAGLGWQAYRTPDAPRYPQRSLEPRLSGLYGPSWSGEQQERGSGEQQEHTSPHK
jgi:hypothetical protein